MMNMATYAELAARLLRDASEFFQHLAKDNPNMAEAMEENAAIYAQVADLVEKDPLGELPTGDDALVVDAE
jgi:uncharacterized membrane-anchored protein YhcB (DUF1043 family)